MPIQDVNPSYEVVKEFVRRIKELRRSLYKDCGISNCRVIDPLLNDVELQAKLLLVARADSHEVNHVQCR